MTGEELWDAIGGSDFFRGAIADAARKIGVSLSSGDIERVVAEFEKQWPDLVRDAQQQAADTVTRATARKEYHRFCRQLGIRPNSQFL